MTTTKIFNTAGGTPVGERRTSTGEQAPQLLHKSWISKHTTGMVGCLLCDYLCWLLSGYSIRGLLPCLYCDGIFAIHPTIMPRYVNPTPEQVYLNLKFASERQCIEHVFGDHRTRFKLFSMLHYFHLFDCGVKVRKQCLLSFFMLNCYYCLDGTRLGYFGHATPTLEEYLPLDELLLPPPAVDLGDTWDFWVHGPHNV